jgi:preprotein translocase subunit SecE
VSDESEVGEGRSVPPADAPDDAVDAAASGESTGAHPADAEVNLVKSDGSDRESELVGATSAGSARAAARRSGVRAGSTPAKGVATKQRDVGREPRLNFFARVRRFLREVVAELRKVIWPARNQMITYTIVVIVFVTFMVALTAGLDVLFAKIVLTVFG